MVQLVDEDVKPGDKKKKVYLVVEDIPRCMSLFPDVRPRPVKNQTPSSKPLIVPVISQLMLL